MVHVVIERAYTQYLIPNHTILRMKNSLTQHEARQDLGEAKDETQQKDERKVVQEADRKGGDGEGDLRSHHHFHPSQPVLRTDKMVEGTSGRDREYSRQRVVYQY